MVRRVSLAVDKQEKVPLPFPAFLTVSLRGRPCTIQLEQVRESLPTGDYLLSNYRDRTIIERKGSLREVAMNCLSRDRLRFLACLSRLRDECSDPVLLLEGTPLQILTLGRKDPRLLLGVDQLLQDLSAHGVEMMLLPSLNSTHRRACGEWAVRRLIAGAGLDG